MKKTIKFLSLLFLLLISAAFVACDKENSTSSNHEHEYVTTVTQATCTQAGERVKTCAGCDFYESEQIPALGHTYEDCNQCSVCEYISTEFFNFRYLGNGTYAVSLKDVDNMPSKIVFPSTYKGMPVTVIE